MFHVFRKVALIQIFLLFFCHDLKAEDFPPRSNTLVTDYTNTLTPQQQQSLEQKLVAFDDSTSTQIAVVIMRSVGGYDISSYAFQLANQWGIGRKQKNNGVLVLVAMEDRAAFIATGYGMEGVLPDALCKRIVNNDIIPNFKQGQYYDGLDAATTSIMQIVSGEYTADHEAQNIPWGVIIFFVFFFFIVIFSRVASTKRYAKTNNIPFWVAWSLLNSMNSRRSRGSWGGFSRGGFGRGGGFGGFGGGGFGGGGAGGRW